jgi:hypothetical protein
MTDGQHEFDPIETLRRADPASSRRLPPGSEVRLRARVMEETMATNEAAAGRGGRTQRGIWQGLAAAGAAAVVLAVVVGSGLIGRNGTVPGTSTGPSNGPAASAVAAASATSRPTAAPSTAPSQSPVAPPPSGQIGGGMGMCVAMYDLETLQDREWAFDGTVTAIDGNQVTFAVTQWFRASGAETETTTVTADGMTSESGLLGGPGLEVGGRYLVTGEDTFAWSCGFTQYWTEATAADWDRVLAD